MKSVSPALTPLMPQMMEEKFVQALAQLVPLLELPAAALSTYQVLKSPSTVSTATVLVIDPTALVTTTV